MNPFRSWAGTPEEAREISERFEPWVQPAPLVLIEDRNGKELWGNCHYRVVLHRYPTGDPFGGGPCARLDISSFDGAARHDWRDFQWIKNQLIGERWEALELYPAAERVQDPSNVFLLYCFPQIPVGIRAPAQILTPEEAIAPQRPFVESPKALP